MDSQDKIMELSWNESGDLLEYLDAVGFLLVNMSCHRIVANYKYCGVIDQRFEDQHVQIPDGANMASLHWFLAIYFGALPIDWENAMSFYHVRGAHDQHKSPWSVRTMEFLVFTEAN
jgi:hypothetical protein